MNDDQALVSGILKGDMRAFRRLIEQHERLVLHMVARIVPGHQDREELCQDVFMKVYERIGDFNFQSRLSTWIATIAYRHALNHLRKRKMHYSEIPDETTFSTQLISSNDPGEVLEERDTDAFVMQLIDHLPMQYKTILTLYHLEHMSYDEISLIMKIPEGTVKSYLFRARNLLKETIKKHSYKEDLL
jgi:RNA polymerase sigma factor (sigma-70 family)